MSLKSFFEPMQLQDTPDSEDYRAIQPYIDAVKIISNVTYQSVYIVDYYKREFIYVSDNPLFLCGHTAAQVRNMGWLYYFNHVPDDDLALLLEINEAGFSFYNQLPVTERLKYCISYDFRIKQPNKHLLLISHKLAPMVLDKSSNIWLALCFVSTSSNSSPGNIIIQKMNSNKWFRYDRNKKHWKLQPSIKLTSFEKEVLLLSNQGLTMQEIGSRLFVTTHTVKYHRGNILKKLNAKNITEAIAYAANYKLI